MKNKRRRGRPAINDWHLLLEMGRVLRGSRKGITPLASKLAEKAGGGGTLESRQSRLAKAYRKHEREILAELRQAAKGSGGQYELGQIASLLRQSPSSLEAAARQTVTPFRAALDSPPQTAFSGLAPVANQLSQIACEAEANSSLLRALRELKVKYPGPLDDG